MLQTLQRKLDSITMYRLVLAVLIILSSLALVFSYFDIIKYSSFGILAGVLITLVVICFFSNLILGKLYKIPINQESALITALILFLILDAPSRPHEWAGIALAGLVAMASKYIITSRGSIIFNPAAFAVLFVSLLGVGYGAWWIADEAMFLPVLLLGLIVLMKIRRFELYFAFIVPAAGLITLSMVQSGSPVSDSLITALTLYPLVFLGTIMLTEPGTLPATRDKILIYGALVGVILGSQIDWGFFSASPHTALLLGNLFTLGVTRRSSTLMKLAHKKQMSPTTYEFAFKPERPVHHEAGQYMELTVPDVKLDARGNRRTFSVASSPKDNLVRFGIKFYSPGSKFKQSLQSLKEGDDILGNHVAGDFILPKDTNTPLVFVAGGIGITPFISMIRSMQDTGKKYKTTLYYFAADKSEVVFTEVLKQAKKAGVRVVIRTGKEARLTDEDIQNSKDALFYLSGPPGLVNSYKQKLRASGVKNIRTDYFTGY